MNTSADGGSSRVSIPHHLRKTIHTIREITGKQHSDEDIFAVYTESFNDPHETAQKLLYLDTFHEVRSKREKKKENLVPITEGSGRSGRRNFASSNTHHETGNGRTTSFKRESRPNHVTGGSRTALPATTNKARNLTVPRAIKVSGPTSLQNGASNHKVQDDIAASVNNGVGEKHPLSKFNSSSENGVVPESTKAISEVVAAPVSVSVVQNNIQDVPSAQISQPVVDNQPEKLLSPTFDRQGPSLMSASHCSSQTDQAVTKNETPSNNGKTQSLLKSDVGERSHVTFPFHLQVAEVLQNGLTFGSFDSNFVKEVSINSGGGDSNFESSYGTRDDEGYSSPTTNGVASVRGGAEDKDHGISNSAPGADPVVHPDHIVLSVEDEHKEEALSNTETHQIAYGQEAPLSVFGLVPSLQALGQPVNTEAAETQPGNLNGQAISLAPYPHEHLFRQQYPPHFFPYGPYYPPFYMPPPYIHQFLSPNGIPQQSYFPPAAALAAPSPIQPLANTENPPTTNPSTVASHISSASALNSTIPSEETTTPLTESAAAWIGQGLGNLQVNPMYNVAFQGQPLGFPVLQAGHGGLMGIHQPTQPMSAASTTYQSLPPPPLPLPLPHTTTAMAEPIGHPPHIAYHQQPQAAVTNWVNNY